MKTLTLANGKSIDLKSKRVVGEDKEEEASSAMEALPALKPLPKEGLKLEDLPTAPKQMNVINAIIGYRLLGIKDPDIVYALGCTEDDLFHIVQSEGFTKSWQMVIDAFVQGQTQTAKDIIANGAMHAAQTIVSVMKTSRNETNKMKAADSILNRVGISEANADNPMAQGLIIKVIRDTETKSIDIKIN